MDKTDQIRHIRKEISTEEKRAVEATTKKEKILAELSTKQLEGKFRKLL